MEQARRRLALSMEEGCGSVGTEACCRGIFPLPLVGMVGVEATVVRYLVNYSGPVYCDYNYMLPLYICQPREHPPSRVQKFVILRAHTKWGESEGTTAGWSRAVRFGERVCSNGSWRNRGVRHFARSGKTTVLPRNAASELSLDGRQRLEPEEETLAASRATSAPPTVEWPEPQTGCRAARTARPPILRGPGQSCRGFRRAPPAQPPAPP